MLIKHSLNNMEYEHFMPFINSFHFCLLGSRKSGHSWLHSGFSLNFFSQRPYLVLVGATNTVSEMTLVLGTIVTSALLFFQLLKCYV